MTVIYSLDHGFINFKLKEILKDDYELYEKVVYKSPNQLIDLLHANNMFDLANDKRYIVKNCIFLVDENEAKICVDLFSALKQNKNLNVFLVVETDKLLTKNKGLNDFLANINIIELPKITNKIFKNIIIDFFNKNQIKLSFELMNVLLNKIPQNVGILENELNKILPFLNVNAPIATIESLVNEYENASIFKLLEYILENKNHAAIALFDSLIVNQYTPLEILQIMATQVLKAIMVKWGVQNNYSDNDICKNLGMSFYQLNQMKKISISTSIKTLESFLNGILLIDIKLKKLNMDSNILRFFLSQGK